MEEVRYSSHSLVRLKSPSIYKNACATLGNTFVSVGRLGSISALLVNPSLLVQLNVREEGKKALAQFVATEEVHQYIRMRVLPWSNTFVSVGQVRINFSSFWCEPVVLVAIERSKMEEGRITLAWPGW
jgi:hypothetical protein